MGVLDFLFGAQKSVAKPTAITTNVIKAPISTKNMTQRELAEISKFVAIDFETANHEISSACSIGLAYSDGERVIATRHFYIKPVPSHFEPENIKIHGITPDMVDGAPTLWNLWDDLEIELLDTVAHNAEFDANVLRQGFKASAPAGMPNRVMAGDFYCTKELGRLIYPYLDGYSLPNMCKELGISLDNHHDATCDAVAAAEIAHKMLKHEGNIVLHMYPLNDFRDRYGYAPKSVDDFKHMKPWGGVSMSKKYAGKQLSSEAIKAPNLDTVENTGTIFFGKKVVITGDFNCMCRAEIAEKIKLLGGDINTVISKRTDIVVVGANPGPAKMSKLQEVQDLGIEVKVIYEDELNKTLTNN